jgi:hypothetical protein
MTRCLQPRSLRTVSIASCVLAGVVSTPDVHGAAQAAPVAFGAMEGRSAGAGQGKSESPTAPKVLPFIEDDYAGALAKARERKLPLFIEAWAPW